jgi:TetR/AcrR family transcriptional regulator
MTTERRRGRVHDAEGAREALLDAAEEIFAQHGFDGARIDAIAAAAAYNKSLIFHYFDDKFGLYHAVVRRMKEQIEREIATVLQSYGNDEAVAEPTEYAETLRVFDEAVARLTKNADTFRAFLEMVVRVGFDFLLAHPNFLRILTWEGAEGWGTFTAIATQFEVEGLKRVREYIEEARDNGLIRPDIDTTMFFAIALGLGQSYLTSLPRYRLIFNDENLATPEALTHAREQIVDFVVHGTMNSAGTS